MTTEQILLGIAAAVVAAWPAIKKAAWALYERLTAVAVGRSYKAVSAVVGYEAAIHDLAVVRTRLASTNLLDDKAKAAIDTLTLALVAGSDK